jgi:hypothetical protein
MKVQSGTIEAVPSKRLFLSIIADYDLDKAICELVDNALDLWIKNGKTKPLNVNIDLDSAQQSIDVSDDAGGIPKKELPNIIGPGRTGNAPTEQIIGIFGVGSKRAVVALAQDIKIKSRFDSAQTHLVEFDDAWLNTESWILPVYDIDEISPNTTCISLSRLRMQITPTTIQSLEMYLRTTYAMFLLDHGVTIKVNGTPVDPVTFDAWSYPPDFPPHEYSGVITTGDGHQVSVKIIAGLTTESSPAAGEYGVYFYCNDRLIARALKSRDVGFIRGIAGLPHPSVSLARVVLFLNGPAQCMPWNSSKSGINTNHPVFGSIHDFITAIVKDWTSLSRRWEGVWDEEVFQHKTGEFKQIQVSDLPKANKSYLPPLPIAKLRYGELIEWTNKPVAKLKPWTVGLFEGIVAVDYLGKQNLSQRNRLNLIILDSTLEIAFKEFLVYESGNPYSEANISRIFCNRSLVHQEIKAFKLFDDDYWKQVNYYYGLRCKLVHERATVGITDDQIHEFRQLVEATLGALFGLKF